MQTWLKLTSYLFTNTTLSPKTELKPYLDHIILAQRAQLRAITGDGEIASGLREDSLYSHRLNLSEDAREFLRGPADLENGVQMPATLGNYARATFQKHHFLLFSGPPRSSAMQGPGCLAGKVNFHQIRQSLNSTDGMKMRLEVTRYRV